MIDAGTDQEHGSLVGNIEPAGAGVWLSYTELAARLKIQPKAIYRRIKRGSMLGRTNPETGTPEVWAPASTGNSEEPRSPSVPLPRVQENGEEHSSLSVPDPERSAALLEVAIGRALAPLAETIAAQQIRIEALIRENERLRQHQEHRSRWEELCSWFRSCFRGPVDGRSLGISVEEQIREHDPALFPDGSR